MTMEKLLFKTEEFEGPLDLLLFLIQKHKLDICDIEISALLEQYLTYIRSLEEQDLEVASEFLEMASRLVYIKTVMLLPRHEEEGLQLKTELQGELLEYQVCRQVAAQLGARNRMYLQFVRAPVKIEADNTYRLTHRADELYAAYQDAAGRGRRRLPPPAHHSHSEIPLPQRTRLLREPFHVERRPQRAGRDLPCGARAGEGAQDHGGGRRGALRPVEAGAPRAGGGTPGCLD